MTKNKKIIIGVAIFIAILIILAIVFYTRYKSLKKEMEKESPTTGGTTPAGGGTTTGGAGTGTGSGTPTPFIPYYGADFTRFAIGQKLKLTSSIVNCYETATAGATVLKSFTAIGEFIGIYKGRVGTTSYIAVDVIIFNFFGYPSVTRCYIYCMGSNVQTYP